MKRCMLLSMILIAAFALFSCSACSEESISIELHEQEWTWEAKESAAFEGQVLFDDVPTGKLLMTLSLSVKPESSEPGEVVFQTVNGKKLTIRKQKSEYVFTPGEETSVQFTGAWKTPEDVPFSKAEILFQIRSEDGSALLAEKSLTVSRDSKEISGTGDGKIRINYDLAGWALWIFAAAGVVWAAAGIRIGLNKKKRKE